MANLDLVGGLSFKKGCYPGQEIVARTHYLGKLKRRMYRLRVPEGVSPRPGDPVYGTGAEPVGTVVDAQPHPQGGIEALAVLRIDAASTGELHLGSPEGSAVVIQPLPYTL
jgi:folate-binding Fe-S cluster repair protein YgfZ